MVKHCFGFFCKIPIFEELSAKMIRTLDKRLIAEFNGREVFSKGELFEFFKKLDSDIKEGTFWWRVYDLKKRNILRSVRRGFYAISRKEYFRPAISPEVKKLARFLSANYGNVNQCIWDTTWLNEFSKHQSGLRIIVVEIEKDLLESAFYSLKDNFRCDFFLDPGERVLELYVSESRAPVIIKKLITRSPLIERTDKKAKFYTPTLEKLLVDLFSEDKLLQHYQGAELVNIYENAIKNYPINYSKLFAYAARRVKEQEIRDFMMQNMSHLVKNLIE